MKNSVLAILALASVVACKKSETTTVESNTDTTAMTAPADTTMTADTASTAMGGKEAAMLNAQDKMFVDNAARGGMMEVMAGEYAAKNATNASVKTLAAMMVKDHTMVNDELKAWASKVSYTLPTALTADQQKKFDELKMKKGAEFDKMYADLMVADHKTTLAMFKKQASEGTDATVKGFAAKTVPALEHHLMESEKTKTAVK